MSIESDISIQSDMPNKDNCKLVYNGLYTNDKCYMCPHSNLPAVAPILSPSGPACNDINPYVNTYIPEGGTTINKIFLNKNSNNTPTPTLATTVFTPSSIRYSCPSGELQNVGTLDKPNYICNMKTDVITCNDNYNLINIITPSATTYSCSKTLPLSCKTGDSLLNIGTNTNPNYQCQSIRCGEYGTFALSGEKCNVKPYTVL